jgi:cytochrome b6-f complex iron-sulfur subunit
MADETKDGPAPEQAGPVDSAARPPEPPVRATEGARAETGAPKTDTAPIPERSAAATSDTFKTAPSAGPVEAAPAVAGGTNAPHVSQPVAEKAGAAGAKPAPAPAPAAAAAAAKATATPAATGTEPAPPVAAKPAAAARPAAKPADADMTRRGFFSWAAVAWVGFTAAIGGCVTAMGRFMFPNVLFEPPTSFKVGRPEDFQPGVVDTRFVDKYGVWVVNNQGRIYALIAICTHLGCPPAWLETQNKFKCPCHGSGYYENGINFEGPTPRPLERARVSISPDDGQIVVEKSQKYQYELGQWDDPNSFIPA